MDASNVLYLQNEHRPTDVAEGVDYTLKSLKSRHHTRKWWAPDARVKPYVRQAGFHCISKLGGVLTLDLPLLTALVERWRSETHTFHLSVGEATVTLKDVGILLGLRVDGREVTGTASYDWREVAQRLLGSTPEPTTMNDSLVNLTWLRENYQFLPEDADEETVKCYARAYILMMMGGTMFPDASGSSVQLLPLPLLQDFAEAETYSWGSAVLATLYRELCKATERGKKEIGGPLLLLQLWAWNHISIGRPTFGGFKTGDQKEERRVRKKKIKESHSTWSIHPPFREQFQNGDALASRWVGCKLVNNDAKDLMYYRDALDLMRSDQFTWTPYTEDVIRRLPPISLSGANVWMSIAPMIFFDMVEWHRPDRVMSHFGQPKHVPDPCDNKVALHMLNRKGRPDTNWALHHSCYACLWGERHQHIASPSVQDTNLARVDRAYMKWYKSITQRFISPKNRQKCGRYQPHAQDLYQAGQHVAPQDHNMLSQLSVDESFFWSDQCISEYPREEQHMPSGSQMPYTPQYTTHHTQQSSMPYTPQYAPEPTQ